MRPPRLWVWMGVIATLVLYALSISLSVTTPSNDGAFDLIWPLPFTAMALVGAIVAARRPENATGWLFLGAGSLMVANAFALAYTASSYQGPSVLPGARVASWLAFWTWMPAIGLIALVFFVFPTGHTLGRWWRFIARAMIVPLAATPIAALPLLRVSGQTLFEASNPARVPGGAWLGALSNGPIPALIAVGFVALVVRFFRSRGVERQQMKWFVLGASTLAFAALVPFVVGTEDPISTPLGAISVLVGMTAVPVTSGIAILRYRLYDIDRIVSRTLAYALVTGVLVGVYAALVVLFQRVLAPLTGSSDLAVAASTLIVAAAFVPLRRRVQSVIDRRFNRARYDAAHTIEGFAARLREETHIDTLTVELQDVVRETMQPAHVTIWMREKP